jgi:hypothetical protein
MAIKKINMENLESYIQHQTIVKLEIENEIMKRIMNSNGFYQLYLEVLERINVPKIAFHFCEDLSRHAIGRCYYPSFEDFEKTFLSKINVTTSQSRKAFLAQRNFLLIHFKEKGFGTWESFSPLVLHYYPIVGITRLKAFYNGSSLDKEVIKYVDFVRQIIA